MKNDLKSATAAPGQWLKTASRWLLRAYAHTQSGARKAWRTLRWRAHWLGPNVFSAPYPQDVNFREQKQEEENRNTRLPEHEEARLEAIWGVEVYGPDEIEALYTALDRHGWTVGSEQEINGALAWVQQQRTYSVYGGAWYNVGIVHRTSDRERFLSDGNHARMPEEVDYLLVRLHQVVPSITCLLVCFVLKDGASLRYEAELATDRSTRRRRGRRWSIFELGPGYLKREAIEQVRADHAELVARWFGAHAPGFFSKLGDVDRFPIAEVVKTRDQDLLAEQGGSYRGSWLSTIVNRGAGDVWESVDIPGLKFTIEQTLWPRESRSWIVMSMPMSTVPEQSLKMYGNSRSSYIAIVHEHVGGALGLFAVTRLLMEAARGIKVAREALPNVTSRRNVLKAIEHIQSVFDSNLGLHAVARELLETSTANGEVSYQCERFTSRRWADDEPQELARALREQIHQRSKRLLEDEHSTRAQLEQMTTILSVRESMKAQRKTQRLSIAAFLVALASMLATFLAVPEKWLANSSAWLARVQGWF